MVVLKLLSDAQRDGDRVLALIRGSAVNQDGRSNGLTAPNVLGPAGDAPPGARERAGLARRHRLRRGARDRDLARRSDRVRGAARGARPRPRRDGSRCVLGAVKTNIGHLEAAAGMAGFIKAVMALQNESHPREPPLPRA